MTIGRGRDWGERVPLPPDVRLFPDDASLFAHLNDPSERVSMGAGVAIVSGDLARTLGAAGGADRFAPGADCLRVPIDLGIVQHDGGEHRFASHVVARASWWHGPIVAVMNAQFIGRWDVAPRSHPNDGWLDVTEVSPTMSLMQRLLASRRLPTAGHVPHPSIVTRRVRAHDWAFERPLSLVVDGAAIGRTRRLRVTVIEDALTVHS